MYSRYFKFSFITKKPPLFYWTQRFITMSKTASHLSLSQARSIQSTFSTPLYIISVLVHVTDPVSHP
jgi:hypothetical protein